MKVPAAVVTAVAGKQALVRYRRHELQVFVDTNPELKWCPAPGCEYAIACSSGGGPSEAADVTCECGKSFCFGCLEEAHRPVDCATVRCWMLKNSAGSENLTWIL